MTAAVTRTNQLSVAISNQKSSFHYYFTMRLLSVFTYVAKSHANLLEQKKVFTTEKSSVLSGIV